MYEVVRLLNAFQRKRCSIDNERIAGNVQISTEVHGERDLDVFQAVP